MKKFLILLLALCFGKLTAQFCFLPPDSFYIKKPVNLCSADFNRDGKKDIAIAGYGYNFAIAVLLGDGAGNFSQVDSLYAPHGSPDGIIAADFNGDTIPDLAITQYSNFDNYVTVYPGSGTGFFTTAGSYTTGDYVYSLCSGDFNGDGKMDIATSDNYLDSVSVLLNAGNGNFNFRVNYKAGKDPAGIISNDFNKDGMDDIATCNQINSNTSVLLATGGGTFNPVTNYLSGGSCISLASGDLNGDTMPDIVVANDLSQGTLSIMLNAGNGSFNSGIPLTHTVGSSPSDVVLADFDSDGKNDAAAINYNTGKITLLPGLGNGNFGPATIYNAGIPSGPNDLLTDDFNGDGKPDLAAVNTNGNHLHVWLNCPLMSVPEIHTSTERLFPNPAKNKITITGIPARCTMTICNSQGAIVKRVDCNNGELDISGLAPGFYSITSGTRYYKFIKSE